MIILLRKPEVLTAWAVSSSTLYVRIADGLLPPPIPLGAKSVAWPSNEVESIVKARIAGKSDEEIRLLVNVLLNKRKEMVA